MLRLVLLLLGLATVAALVWFIGPARILQAAAGLGPAALLVIFLPSALMYALETLGWRLTLGRHAGTVSFGRLFAIRTAGEVVNMTTPTAYVGGEPMKAYLLKRYGVPLVEGFASVISAKTTMTLAQIIFILLGIGLSFLTIRQSGTAAETGGSAGIHVMAAVMSMGLLLFGVAMFVTVQRRGLFRSLLAVLRYCRIRIRVLESRQDQLEALDRTIMRFYGHAKPAFLLSTGAHFLGWLAEGLEVYAILSYLGPSVDVLASVSIAGLAVLIKGGTFFIPGSVGAQESGYVVLLMAFGYSDVAALTFAVVRRLREVVWIVIGLLCLLAMGGFSGRGTVVDARGPA